MHKCWEVSELVTAIFLYATENAYLAYVGACSWPIPGSSTLAVLARTCKLFSEPALNILWHYMPNLNPLIRCLPSDAVETVPKDAPSASLGAKIVRNFYPFGN